MTIAELLSKPEFWSALFGALAAFLLGVLATWWANLNAKRTSGNLAIIALSQMSSLMENVRYELLVKEPIRIHEILHRAPLPFELRPVAGLPEILPRIQVDGLGFLADSHDPDILNRLLTVERAFAAMIDVLRRHEVAHAKFTELMNSFDPTGQRPFGPEVVLQVMGAKVPIEIDTLIESLEKGLPETRDVLLEVGKQLHNILRVQIPVRRLVGFSSIPRTRLADEPPDLTKPTLWRRVTRWSFDVLMKRRRLRAPPKAPLAGATDPRPPAIKRYPPRSWDSREAPAKLFEDSGFLAGEAPWIAQVRLRHKAWFELISKLNRFAMSVLFREVPKVPEELFVAALYARSVETFQGAVLLAERGMAACSRTLVRGCVETAVAIGCVRRDKSFLAKLEEDHDKHRAATANDLLQLPEADANISPEQRAELRQLVAELSARYELPHPLRINWAVASSVAAMTDLYLTVYRQTSSDAAHATLSALNRYVVSDSSGNIVGFKFGPSIEDPADTLSAVIAALLHATEAKLLGLSDAAAEGSLRGFVIEWRASGDLWIDKEPAGQLLAGVSGPSVSPAPVATTSRRAARRGPVRVRLTEDIEMLHFTRASLRIMSARLLTRRTP